MTAPESLFNQDSLRDALRAYEEDVANILGYDEYDETGEDNEGDDVELDLEFGISSSTSEDDNDDLSFAEQDSPIVQEALKRSANADKDDNDDESVADERPFSLGIDALLPKDGHGDIEREQLREKYRQQQLTAEARRKLELPPPPPLFDKYSSSSTHEQQSSNNSRPLPGLLGSARDPHVSSYHSLLNSSSLPPRTGTGSELLYPVHEVPPFYRFQEAEPLAPVDPSLVSEQILHDAERLANPLNLLNRIVYDSVDGKHTKPAVVEDEQSQDARSGGIAFESRFESGNLRRAIQVYEYEYDMILRFDINTKGHTQWFYFSVSNASSDQIYKFNIINLLKPDSLYNSGMQPLVFSVRKSMEQGIGWHRAGSDMCYYQNHLKRKSGYFYTFTWKYRFEYENDIVYFAYCYPYTYTDLQLYLRKLEQDPVRRNRFRRRTLCQTLAGNNCDLLTITSFQCDPESLRSRKGIILSARVHPGESNASWMMKGVIDYLTGPSLGAKILRDNFVFKIVPMLNPDGVINGNYRCSLAGVDLNRRWLDPSKKLHPTIYHTKHMIKRVMEDREVLLFCDFHGHSRKKNIFMYGCDAMYAYTSKNSAIAAVAPRRLQERVFPLLLDKIADHFVYADCSFKVQKSKESTARVVVWKELGIQNAYTLEASFAAPSGGPGEDMHFTPFQLEEMGHYFCECLLTYCDPSNAAVTAIEAELEIRHPPKDETSSGVGIERTLLPEDDEDSVGSDDEEDFNEATRKKPKLKKKKRTRKETPTGAGSSALSSRASSRSKVEARDASGDKAAARPTRSGRSGAGYASDRSSQKPSRVQKLSGKGARSGSKKSKGSVSDTETVRGKRTASKSRVARNSSPAGGSNAPRSAAARSNPDCSIVESKEFNMQAPPENKALMNVVQSEAQRTGSNLSTGSGGSSGLPPKAPPPAGPSNSDSSINAGKPAEKKKKKKKAVAK